MTLAQFLAALREGGQAAADALRAAPAALLTEALASLSTEVDRLGAETDLSEATVSALETNVADRGAVVQEQARRTDLAARRDAAMSTQNPADGSNVEGNLPAGPAGHPQMPADASRHGAAAGHPDNRDDHPAGAGRAHPGDNQANQHPPTGLPNAQTPTDGDPPAQGGGQASSSGTEVFTPGQPGYTPRTRGGIAGQRPDAPDAAGTERVSAGTVALTTRTAAGLGGQVVPGTQVTTRAQLHDVFAERAEGLFGASGRGADGSYPVVRVTAEYPESRQLSGDDAAHNTTIVAAATDYRDQTIVAAGGLCAPLDVRTDIDVSGVTTRPILNALTRFAAPKGGLQFRAPMDALAMTSGLGVWTMEMDAAVAPLSNPNANIPDPFKSCYVADCPGSVEAIIYSTYLCLEFPNITAKFDPEWVRATLQAAEITHARWSENQLLARIASASRIVVGKRQLSAVRDILATYDKVISRFRNRHRLDGTVTLRTIMPQWVPQMIATDVLRGMSTTTYDATFAVTVAQIEAWFRTRNVAVTWHLDGLDGVTKNGVTIPDQHYGNVADTAGQVVPTWPTAIDSVLYVDGDWLYLDGGTLDLGLVRDSALNARNRYRIFRENFEGVAFTGQESLRVVLPVRPTGAMVGTVAPNTISDTAGSVANAFDPSAA